MQRISGTEATKLKELVSKMRTAMLTTSHDGQLRTRPMACQENDYEAGVLWFMTSREGDKVDEIQHDSAVNVAFVDQADHRYVSVCGRAQAVKDLAKQKELWTDFAKIWFSGPEDPNIVLIRVDIDGIEYWDGPSSTMVALFGWLKAKVTGKPVELGENETIQPMAC